MATYTWATGSVGAQNWRVAANWGGVAFPDAIGDIALLNSAITSQATITVNTAATIGAMTIGSSTAGRVFVVQGGTLTLDNGGTQPVITVANSSVLGTALNSALVSNNGVKFQTATTTSAGRLSIGGTSPNLIGTITFDTTGASGNAFTITSDAALGPTTNTVQFAKGTFPFWVPRTWNHPVVFLSLGGDVASTGDAIFANGASLAAGVVITTSTSTGTLQFTGGSLSAPDANTGFRAWGPNTLTVSCNTSGYLGYFHSRDTGALSFGGSTNHSAAFIYLESRSTSATTLNVTTEGPTPGIPLHLDTVIRTVGTTTASVRFSGVSFSCTSFYFGTPGSVTPATTYSIASGQTVKVTSTLPANSTSSSSTLTIARTSGVGQAVMEWACTNTLQNYAFSVTAGAALNISTNAGLPNTGTGSITASNGQIGLKGGIVTNTNRPFTISGSGFNSAGALRNISDANSCGNLITLSAAATIGADSGTLTLTNATGVSGAFPLTLAPATGAKIELTTSKINTGSTVTQSTEGTVVFKLRGNNTQYNVNSGTYSPQPATDIDVTTAVGGTVTVANIGKIKTLASVNSGKAKFENLTFSAPSGANYATVHIGAATL